MDEGDTDGVVKTLVDKGFTSEDAERITGLKLRPLQEAEQREESIKQAMEQHGLTREEVEEVLDGPKR